MMRDCANCVIDRKSCVEFHHVHVLGARAKMIMHVQELRESSRSWVFPFELIVDGKSACIDYFISIGNEMGYLMIR